MIEMLSDAAMFLILTGLIGYFIGTLFICYISIIGIALLLTIEHSYNEITEELPDNLSVHDSDSI